MAAAHEHWQAQSEIYTLCALDGQELTDFEAHLAAGCPVCAADIRETREALGLLHRALAHMEPSASVKTRVLEQIEIEKIVPITTKPRTAQPRWQVITGTLAAGIAGLVIGGAFYRVYYEPRHRVSTAVVDLLRDPATRDQPLYGTGPTPAARGRFLWNESGEGHIFVNNLPAAPEGKIYAVWTIAKSSAPRFVGTVKTDTLGQGSLHINSPRSDQPVGTFAVTLEPAGTTTAPTGPIVLVSKPS